MLIRDVEHTVRAKGFAIDYLCILLVEVGVKFRPRRVNRWRLMKTKEGGTWRFNGTKDCKTVAEISGRTVSGYTNYQYYVTDLAVGIAGHHWICWLLCTIQWERLITMTGQCPVIEVLSNLNMPLLITVASPSKAWTVFFRSDVGIVGSNPTWDIDVCVLLFCVCAVLSCVQVAALRLAEPPSKEPCRLCMD
jgi:hypothetical protein